MIRRLVLGLALALMLPVAAMAQPVTQTGAVQTPGGQPLQLNPTTQYNQSCNGGLGGIVGQTYSAVVCGPPAPYRPTIVPLDVATVTTGTPATVLNANHRTAGGFLITSNAAGMCISENGTAGTTTATVAGVATVCVAANQRYTLLPSANAVSVTSPGTGVAISGYGQQ